MMTAKKLRLMNKEEVKEFIRERLPINISKCDLRHIKEEDLVKEHRRFNQSGYDNIDGAGSCVRHNTSILYEFADLGIFDYTRYLYLDFYKGDGIIYLAYWQNGYDVHHHIINMAGEGKGTTEIIYKIFELTIFSDKGMRRRI